jgi:sugar transferase (PEP-CTERM/EpsH1 system associated)
MSTPSRPKLLYLVHRVPYPPDKGDRIRSYHLLRHLAEHFDVYLAYLTDAAPPANNSPDSPPSALASPLPAAAAEAATLSALRRLAVEVAAVPVAPRGRWFAAAASLLCGRSATEGLFRSRALRATLDRWRAHRQFDATVVFCSSMFQYVQPSAGPGGAAGRLVVDLVDVDSQKWFDYAAQVRGPRRWLYALEGRRLRRVECRAAAAAAAVTLVSPAEAECFRRVCPAGRVLGVYNGVDLEYFQPAAAAAGSPPSAPGSPPAAAGSPLSPLSSPPAPPTVVFTGALDYRANVDALVWFCGQVWPSIVSRRPDAVLKIIGRHATPAVRRLAERPGVVLVGGVPDVRPHLAAASLAIAPLRVARGIQNKVLEALAMGKAVVASPQAVEGLSATHDNELLVAACPAEWIAAIHRLLEDAPLARRLGAAGRRHVEQHHDWSACLAPFTRLLTDPAPDSPLAALGSGRLTPALSS